MWIFTTKGFLSIVQHNAFLDCFQVKSRVIEPLEEMWPDHEIYYYEALVRIWTEMYRYQTKMEGDK